MALECRPFQALCPIYDTSFHHLGSVLVISSCVTDDHTLSALTRYPFISSVGPVGSAGFYQGITKLQSRFGWAGFSPGGSGEESVSRVIQVQESSSLCCGTEVPIFLAAGQELLSALLPTLLVMSPPPSSGQQRCVGYLSCFESF